MKTHALQFPVFVEDLDRADDPGTSLAISTLLPGVKARAIAASGDYLLLEASPSTAIPFDRTKRLVVLIPENELDENALAHRIWRMAFPGELEVLFLSRLPEPGSEAYLRMRLAGLASQVRDERVQASYSIATGKNWVAAVGQVWRRGDLLVCLHRHPISGLLKKRLDLPKQLVESLAAPVYSMGCSHLSPSLRQLRMRKEWLAWTGFLGILAAFGWVQLQISRTVVGNQGVFLMMFIVLLEIAILYKINEHTL